MPSGLANEAIEWISGRSPVGGWTLSGLVEMNVWASENSMSANCGARVRLYKRTAAGSETELTGSPWDDGVEFGTSRAAMNWTFTPTSMSFAEDDRLIVRMFTTAAGGTMASGFTCSASFDGPTAAADGDSYITLNETVTFKDDDPWQHYAHFDGTDGSTTFTVEGDHDATFQNFSPRGNAQLDTAQSVFGTASLLLDGTGDWLDPGSGSTPANNYTRNPMFNFGTEVLFTIDMRIRPNSTAAQGNFYAHGTLPESFQWYLAAGGQIRLFQNGSDRITGSTLSTATWYHVALTCDSSRNVRMFVDGTQVGSTFDSSAVNWTTNAFTSVGPILGSDGTNSFNGWIDEFHIDIGLARWTANFTPPTTAYPLVPEAPTFTWYAPLGVAAPIPRTQRPGHAFVPLDTFQPNTERIDKWLQPLGKAVPIPRYRQGEHRVPFNTPQFVEAAGVNWSPWLSRAAPRPPVNQGQAAVPFDTLQDNTETIDKWLRELSRAAKRPPVWPGFAVVPFDTLQDNTETIDKWLQPLGKAVPFQRLDPWGFTEVPFDTFQPNTQTIDKWLQPLGRAVPFQRPYPWGSTFVPLDTFQTNTQTIDKWLQALSSARRILPDTVGFYVAPAFVAEDNTITIDRWLQPLGKAVPFQRFNPWGNAFVPFDTFQPNTQTIDKWLQPLGRAVPFQRLDPWGFAEVPFDTLQDNTETIDRWLQPLSRAARIPRIAPPGSSFFAMDTVQIYINTETIDKWQQALSRAAKIPYYQAGYSVVPFDTFQPNTATIDKWLQRLSRSAPIPRSAPLGASIVPFDTAQVIANTVTIDKWLRELSRAARIPYYALGSTSVPFDTRQFNTGTVSTWHVALSRAARIPRYAAGFHVRTLTEIFEHITIEKWQRPLSRAVPIPRYRQGAFDFPEFPMPAIVNTVTIEKWLQALSRAAARPPVWQGSFHVPFDTPFVAPVPPRTTRSRRGPLAADHRSNLATGKRSNVPTDRRSN